MIYEVFALLLKFSGSQKLTLDLLKKVGSRKKTNLVTSKLQRKMTGTEDCSTTHLFNGVSLIWSKQINMGIEGENESDFADRELRMQEHDMQSIRVSFESVSDQELDDDAVGDDVGASTRTILEFSVDGHWEVGKHLMTKGNYLEVRELAMNRIHWKRVVNTFVLEKVEKVKLESLSTVGTEKIDAVRAPRLDVVRSLDPGVPPRIAIYIK